ncbi:MAG: adenylate/guanylate cyclase domain-containing protein [Verrucomicrobia bacterium]|nr:adenylate/guanylate cyclase domain-containing protein [Verrucomicrobiota bacterium]
MSARTTNKLLIGAAIGFAAGLASLALWSAGYLDQFERNTWDLRVRWLCHEGEATDMVRVILIDQYSLDWAKANHKWKWEWYREIYGEIARYCRESGAKAVILDMSFYDASEGGDEDETLGAAMRSASNVVAVMHLGRESGVVKQWPQATPLPRITVSNLQAFLSIGDRSRSMVFPGATMPIPEVATNAACLGDVLQNPDADGTYRRVSLFRLFDGKVVPSLALAGLAAGEGGVAVESRGRELIVNGRSIPVDDGGSALLNFRGPSQTHRTVSAAQVIESLLQRKKGAPERIPAGFFKDRYVFLGCSAFGLYDLRQSAVSGVYPGVEVHATALDNLLSGDFFNQPSMGTTIVLVLVYGLCCALVLGFTSNALRSGLLLLAFLVLPVGVSAWAYNRGLNIPLLVYELAAFGGSLGAIIMNYALEGHQRRFLRKAFQQYLSPDVIDQIVNDPSKLILGGQTKELSIMFSDLKGFTTISEALRPEKTTALLNEYLTAMTTIIHGQQGTIDKYIGDCIVAFWNAPVDQPDHAVRAVRAAINCRQKLAGIREHLKRRYSVDVYARSAIATGPVIVGNIGSAQHFDYSFIGDTGNLSSRLEGANKEFGTWLLISEDTRRAIGDEFAVREIGLLRVVGRREPVRVFEPMTKEEYASREKAIEVFLRGLEAYRAGGFAEAAAIFKPNRDVDPPSAAYYERCLESIEHPSPEWSGVWEMTHK